jgi:hypothetical protein
MQESIETLFSVDARLIKLLARPFPRVPQDVGENGRKVFADNKEESCPSLMPINTRPLSLAAALRAIDEKKDEDWLFTCYSCNEIHSMADFLRPDFAHW